MSKACKILVINSGSSSIKFELFHMPDRTVEASGVLQRIGDELSELKAHVKGEMHHVRHPIRDHAEGLQLIMAGLVDSEHGGLQDISEIGAVGHRVVHGGEAFASTVLITDEVVQAIEDHVSLAPLHNPPNLEGIAVARELLPDVPQVAVFDTSFHHSMPPRAYVYALPYDLYTEHRVRRYGFHGTSHRYVMLRAAEMLGRAPEQTNLITCHLGNGCSMAAIEGGRSIDTSMGLTPLEGLVMGTRCGDLDPAIGSYLEGVLDVDGRDIDNLLNKKSGLLGISGKSNDVRTILEAEEAGDERAKLALDIYCYRVRKYIGAYTAALGRVAAVVFTAGVGENAPAIRTRCLSRLERLGYRVDEEKNAAAVGVEADIAEEGSPSRVLVVPTDEELMIALDTYNLAFSD